MHPRWYLSSSFYLILSLKLDLTFADDVFLWIFRGVSFYFFRTKTASNLAVFPSNWGKKISFAATPQRAVSFVSMQNRVLLALPFLFLNAIPTG